MPTSLRIGPYRFFFYANGRDEPAHAHVQRERNTAKFWIDPVRKIAGVLMMQILPFVDTSALKLFTDFETTVYQSLDTK